VRIVLNRPAAERRSFRNQVLGYRKNLKSSLMRIEHSAAPLDWFAQARPQQLASAGTANAFDTGAATGDELTLTEPNNNPPPADIGKLKSSTPAFGVAPRDGVIHVEDVRANYQEKRDAFYAQLRGRFADAGFTTPPEIRLQTGGDGSVVVASDHPQRAEIEELFRESPELRRTFVELDAQAGFLRAADEASAFQKAYWADPLQALQEFRHLFERQTPGQYTLIVTADAIGERFL
jgi:hypothetical protein